MRLGERVRATTAPKRGYVFGGTPQRRVFKVRSKKSLLAPLLKNGYALPILAREPGRLLWTFYDFAHPDDGNTYPWLSRQHLLMDRRYE